MSENLTVGFIGNPNCGKTTLYNAFTGANLKVAKFYPQFHHNRPSLDPHDDYAGVATLPHDDAPDDPVITPIHYE